MIQTGTNSRSDLSGEYVGGIPLEVGYIGENCFTNGWKWE